MSLHWLMNSRKRPRPRAFRTAYEARELEKQLSLILEGLLVVSMVLAMMSSLDSARLLRLIRKRLQNQVFNCLSTVFTYDIYLPLLNPSSLAYKRPTKAVSEVRRRRGRFGSAAV